MAMTLKERKANEEAREAKIYNALFSTSKQLEEAKRSKKQKKKTVDDLLKMLDIEDIMPSAIRNVSSYQPRSCNLDKQLVGLIQHLFVQYPVPYFLYDACIMPVPDPYKKWVIPQRNFAFMRDIYRGWLVTLAQGGSFKKSVKGFMTSAESAMFLKAPTGKEIHENVWWAKLKSAGIQDSLACKLVDRIFTNHFFDDPDGRLHEVITFYTNHHTKMDKETMDGVTDFIAWKLTNETSFRYKGRTASSMVKLSNDWHMLMQKAKLGNHIEWDSLGFPDWQHEIKNKVWCVTELCTNKELASEGRKQKHCVYGYVSRCADGRSHIFSIRAFEKRIVSITLEGEVTYDKSSELHRVTFETASLSIVQIRGHMNTKASCDEMSVLKLWAGEKGLTILRV